MKVMHILDSLNRGGTEMLTLDVCRNARANNLDLTLVVTGSGELESEFKNSGAHFYRLERRGPVDLKLARKIRSIIEENRIEVVHTHQAVEALHAYLATRRSANIKRAMTFHLCTSDAKNKLALNLLVPRMHANVAVSQELLNCLQATAGFDTTERFYVVHNGVDRHRLKPTGTDLRKELGIAANNLLLGMIANFYPDRRKDQLTICRSLPAFFAAVPEAHFVFVGGDVDAGPEMERCVAACHDLNITDRVRFLGNRADIPDILQALDIYVHSSVNESLGMAVVEAMLSGVATVVSDIGALLEVTGNGEVAVVFRTGDAGDLAAKLVALAGDADRRGELAQRGQDYALRHFTIEAHISRLIELYNKI